MSLFCRSMVFAGLLVSTFAGCDNSPSTKVLTGEVEKDPSVVGQDNTVTGGDPSAPEPKPEAK